MLHRHHRRPVFVDCHCRNERTQFALSHWNKVLKVMLLWFVVKKTVISYKNTTATTDSLRISANNNSLKHPSARSHDRAQNDKRDHVISVQRMSVGPIGGQFLAAAAVAVDKDRSPMGRWGRCSIYRHPTDGHTDRQTDRQTNEMRSQYRALH